MRSSQTVAAAVLSCAASVSAFWRMPCRHQTGIGRLDPMVDPGTISPHVHTITGSNGFGFEASFETLTAEGTCTACDVTQDHSAYWTPTMNFMYENGTTVMVPQVGGMLAYYLFYLDKIKAFPEGFQMLAGNVSRRSFEGPVPDIELSLWATDATGVAEQSFLQQRSLGFNCLNYDIDPEPSLYRHTMPSKDYMDEHCTDGLRLELAFPSCGTGELDSDDHQSHMAYPSLVKEGNCPDGYDVHYPFLFYETIWATNAFVGEPGQFVLSYGDPVGAGYHGDFIMGWESEQFLQDAIDTCTSDSGDITACDLFDIQDDSEAANCEFKMPDELKHDNVEGPRAGLAVDVPIQYGPEPATTYKVAGKKDNPTVGVDSTGITMSSSMPTVTYSPADPEETKSAQGGIIVAMQTDDGESPTAVEVPQTPSTTPPPAPEATGPKGSIISTKYITEGNTVIELFIEQVQVTVTASMTTTEDAMHKRHLHRHQHHAHH